MDDRIKATLTNNKISEKQFKAQLDLEDFSKRLGGDIAKSGKWQAGAKNYMATHYAPKFLEACIRVWRSSQVAVQMYGADMAIMNNEIAVKQVCLEILHFVLSDVEETWSRVKISNEAGKIAEYVMFLLSPAFQKSGHLDSLRRMNGRNLGMKEMMNRMKDKGFGIAARNYKVLSIPQRQKLGFAILEIVRTVTGLFEWELTWVEKKKSIYKLKFSDTYWKFIQDWGHCLETMRPYYMPMIVPPRPWDLKNKGGYYRIQMSYCGTMDSEEVEAALSLSDRCVLGSINYLQAQPFSWNHFTVDTALACWQNNVSIGHLPRRDRLKQPVNKEYADKENGGTQYWSDMYLWRRDRLKNVHRTRFTRAVAVYKELKQQEKLWFPWTVDFRGRKNQRSAVNYQGNDLYRSMWTFAGEGSVLANHLKEIWWAFGDAAGLPKCWQTREVWYRENTAAILQAGIDPLGRIAFWEGRKEPWRFITLCREVFLAHQDPSYRTNLVFSLDQTNSGYGHLAALTRDRVLAARCNLIGGEYHDLYGDVREVVIGLVIRDLEQDNHNLHARWWVHNGKVSIDRALIKDAVMPVVYNRSHLTLMAVIRDHIEDAYVNFLVDDGEGGQLKTKNLATYLAGRIHEAVKMIMPGVNNLDRWLRNYISLFGKDEMPGFTTPNDTWVEVGQKASRMETCQLVMSGKRMSFSVRDEVEEVDHKRSAQGLAANYLHALDASFLEKFVHHWGTCYQQPIVTVHDCFGTTLENVSLMRKELCDQFNRIYSEDHGFKPMMFAVANLTPKNKSRMPAFPEVGDLSLTEIGQNPFLFS